MSKFICKKPAPGTLANRAMLVYTSEGQEAKMAARTTGSKYIKTLKLENVLG